MCLAPAQSSWSSFVPDHTVPYGTALLGGVFPGTSCPATIAPSLRHNSQEALARGCCEMSASASRRDDTDRSLARSAWESVPRKNRPVGYGMIGHEGQQREGLGQDAKQIPEILRGKISQTTQTIGGRARSEGEPESWPRLFCSGRISAILSAKFPDFSP